MPRTSSVGGDVSAPTSVYLTVKEVVALARCEHNAVRRAIHLGHLQAFQPANKLLVREQDANAWIQSRGARITVPDERPRKPRPHVSPPAGTVAKLRHLERQLTIDDVQSV